MARAQANIISAAPVGSGTAKTSRNESEFVSLPAMLEMEAADEAVNW